jgi:5-methylcytosine-specific restriction endonuclease McrA
LDRLRNEEGYNWDNVVACCWRCNRWKHTLTKEDFLSHVKKIHDHNHL